MVEEDEGRERLLGFLSTERRQLEQLARRFVKSREVAEDLLQDLALKLMQVKDPSSVRNLRFYVYTAIRRLAFDHLAKEASRRRYMTTDAGGDRLDELCMDEREPTRLFQCECLLRELTARSSHFTPEAWQAFQLTIEGHTQREIAKCLNCSVGTVNAMLKSVRTAAVHLCQNHLSSDGDSW